MKFYLIDYELNYNDDPITITARYTMLDTPGQLEITINHENKPVIDTIIKALTKLYRNDKITIFYKNLMYKTNNGYYQEYKRY